MKIPTTVPTSPFAKSACVCFVKQNHLHDASKKSKSLLEEPLSVRMMRCNTAQRLARTTQLEKLLDVIHMHYTQCRRGRHSRLISWLVTNQFANGQSPHKQYPYCNCSFICLDQCVCKRVSSTTLSVGQLFCMKDFRVSIVMSWASWQKCSHPISVAVRGSKMQDAWDPDLTH